MQITKLIFSIFAFTVVSVSVIPTAFGVESSARSLGPIQLYSCSDGTWCNDYCSGGGYTYWICSEGYVFRAMMHNQYQRQLSGTHSIADIATA